MVPLPLSITIGTLCRLASAIVTGLKVRDAGERAFAANLLGDREGHAARAFNKQYQEKGI
jgi:hypothetical protein